MTQKINLDAVAKEKMAEIIPRVKTDVERYTDLVMKREAQVREYEQKPLLTEAETEQLTRAKKDVVYFYEKLKQAREKEQLQNISPTLEPVVTSIENRIKETQHKLDAKFEELANLKDFSAEAQRPIRTQIDNLDKAREATINQAANDLVNFIPKNKPLLPDLIEKVPMINDQLNKPEKKPGLLSRIKNFFSGEKLIEAPKTPEPLEIKLPKLDDAVKARLADFDFKKPENIPKPKESPSGLRRVPIDSIGKFTIEPTQ